MNDQNYITSFTVEQTPEEVFAKINNVQGWWLGEPGVEGNTDKLGDEFTYGYEPYHYSKQKVTELISGKKIAWEVLDSNLSFLKDKGEWAGTRIIFEIGWAGKKTEVRFTHIGLVPQVECYDSCSNGWNTYINGSLRSLITTGVGVKPSF